MKYLCATRRTVEHRYDAQSLTTRSNSLNEANGVVVKLLANCTSSESSVLDRFICALCVFLAAIRNVLLQ